MEQNCIVCIANFKTVLLLRIRVREFVSPGVLRDEVAFFPENVLISQCDAQSRSWQLPDLH